MRKTGTLFKVLRDSDDSSDDYEPFSEKNILDQDSDSVLGESDSNEITNAPPEEAGITRGGACRKRRRRRRRTVTICTGNCRYEVVRRVAYRLGMREVNEDDSWNIFWTDLSISIERCKDMKRFQKINHFPGMSEICRKDLLARNLNRMLKLYPEEYSFFPKSWCLPADVADVISYSRVNKNKTYILKPDIGCQGRGIIITKSLKDVRPQDKMICQVYITKPFLIDGYKFDFRVYTLITSCDPLRIFVYNDGLVRFATNRYREPTGGNAANIYMHLTNYAVNKHNRMYIVDDEMGSKRKISTLNRWFENKSYDLHSIWSATDDVIIKTIIAAQPMLKHSYHTCFPCHDYTYACFEILGFDILLDEHLKPFVLEVNHSPSFHTDTQIDRDIKEGLLRDTFEILNLQQCDKKKIIEEDRKRVRDRLLKGIYKDQNSGDGEANVHCPLTVQTKWEDEHKGNFRKVYPCDDHEKYDKFFQQNTSSLFQDTAASRAREEASRVQREETSRNKARMEAQKAGRLVLEKITRPESPSRKAVTEKPSLRRIRQIQLSKSISNSFNPVNIIEADEIERQYQLKQRECLLKSHGLVEQIYQGLKKNRALRPEDEIKYGQLIKPQIMPFDDAALNKQPVKIFNSMLTDSIGGSKNNLLGKMISDNEKVSVSSNLSFNAYENKDLCVKSNEAPISMRPIPASKWPFLPISYSSILPSLPTIQGVSDVRSTKAQVARAFSNNAKLKQLERRERRLHRAT